MTKTVYVAITPSEFVSDFDAAAQEVSQWFSATALGVMALLTVAALIRYAVNTTRGQ